MKNIGYATGAAIGILLVLFPIRAESQVTSPPLDTSVKLSTPVVKFDPAQVFINIQNKAVADRKAAEVATSAALEAARLAEEQRVAQLATQKAKEAVVTSNVRPVTVTQSYPQSDNFYKAFIYSHESGNDPARYNSIGCLGLGQACPASKLLTVCPTMDYACEDAWFTAYAQKYGGWAGAYEFWLAHSWW